MWLGLSAVINNIVTPVMDEVVGHLLYTGLFIVDTVTSLHTNTSLG